MYQLNDKVKNLTPYDPVAGTYKIRLDANESFINPGEMYGEEIGEAVKNIPLNRYPDPDCVELREAFGKAYGIDPRLTVAGNGSDELITVILGAFLQQGDRIATLTPDFSMYGFYGETYERGNLKIVKNQDLSINVDKTIKELISLKPQALIFSNPCSPTSLVLKKEEVEKIIKATDTLIILDEAYMEFSDQSLLKDVEKYDNLIILKTCSKAWGIAAIRLGFAISNKTIVDALNCVRSPYNVNGITQAVGKVILSHTEYIEEAKKQILAGREELYNGLAALKEKFEAMRQVIKTQANFVLVEFPGEEEAREVYKRLLEQSIIVRILGKYLRITTGSAEENAALVSALTSIMEEIS